MTKESLGGFRVGTGLNPSEKSSVDLLKAQCAAVIDFLDRNIPDKPGEVARLKALAMTATEEAAMWGVKALTKPERK